MNELELLKLEIESAWESFCDGDKNQSTARLKPEIQSLVKLAFSAGYTIGAQATYRSVKNERK